MYYLKGLSKYNTGDVDGAISDYSEPFRIDPKYADPYYARAICRQAKNKPGVCEDLKIAVDLGLASAKGIYEEVCGL